MLLALGESIEDILNSFYSHEKVNYDPSTDTFSKDINSSLLSYQRASVDILNPDTGERIVSATRRFSERIIEKIKSAKLKSLPITEDDLVGMYLVDSFQKNSEEPEAVENSLIQEITEDTIAFIKENKITKFNIYYVDNSSFTSSLVVTINVLESTVFGKT